MKLETNKAWWSTAFKTDEMTKTNNCAGIYRQPAETYEAVTENTKFWAKITTANRMELFVLIIL